MSTRRSLNSWAHCSARSTSSSDPRTTVEHRDELGHRQAAGDRRRPGRSSRRRPRPAWPPRPPTATAWPCADRAGRDDGGGEGTQKIGLPGRRPPRARPSARSFSRSTQNSTSAALWAMAWPFTDRLGGLVADLGVADVDDPRPAPPGQVGCRSQCAAPFQRPVAGNDHVLVHGAHHGPIRPPAVANSPQLGHWRHEGSERPRSGPRPRRPRGLHFRGPRELWRLRG